MRAELDDIFDDDGHCIEVWSKDVRLYRSGSFEYRLRGEFCDLIMTEDDMPMYKTYPVDVTGNAVFKDGATYLIEVDYEKNHASIVKR